MKKVSTLFLILTCFAFATASLAQEPFTNCAAAFLNNKLVVDEYTDTGKCILSKMATGTLTVCTASLSPTESFPTGKIKFKIAIRDRNTRTLMMLSDKTYLQVDVRDVMAKCRPGDFIVLLTMKDEYALPHNEILVQ